MPPVLGDIAHETHRAASAIFRAAGIGIDDVDFIDLYGCAKDARGRRIVARASDETLANVGGGQPLEGESVRVSGAHPPIYTL